MLFIVIDGQYYINYFLTLIEVAFIFIFLYFAHSMVMTALLDEKSQKARRANSSSRWISLLIVFGIGVASRYIIGFIGYYVIAIRILDTLFFSLVVMTTLYFPLYIIFLKKFDSENFFRKPKLRKIFLKRTLFVIIVSGITFSIFLSIDLLGIPLYDYLPADPQNPFYDPFYLGFQWAFIAVVICVVVSRLIIAFLSSEKKPPKIVVRKATIVSSVTAFGIWSIQLIIVELYLSRLFGITLYEQDIRVLFAVVAFIYFSCFFISLYKIFLPRQRREKQVLVRDFIKKEETETAQIEEQEVVLDVQDLATRFYTEEGIVYAVEGISFKIYKGEVLGFVGETGCGKSVSALSILQLILPPGKIVRGKVNFLNEDLLTKSTKEMLSYRGDKITMIFQDPLNSLNPVFTVGKQISEVYLLHKEEELMIEANQKNKGFYDVLRERTLQILRDLNIPSPENVIDRYPHELSGGMRQRVQIAMAIACSPVLLIADEPTTALDVTVQNQILKLMKDLRKDYNTSILFITHDLGIISKMCDRVAVMYSGSIVEYGITNTLFTTPYHPYTKGLLSAVPMEGREDTKLTIIPGTVPNLIYPPSGCRFHPRCPNRFKPCDSIKPKSIEVAPNYFVSCHLYDPELNSKEVN